MTAHYQHYVHSMLAIPGWIPIIWLLALFAIVVICALLNRQTARDEQCKRDEREYGKGEES